MATKRTVTKADSAVGSDSSHGTKRHPFGTQFERAYQAQLSWSQQKVSQRAAIIGRLRGLIVQHRRELASAIDSPSRRDYRETVSSELLPLADAAKWLSRKAKPILAPRYVEAGGPMWLGRIRTTVHRVPHGLVLIIGTWIYPLFLTGVQMLHALVAGNAVVVKPAPGAERVTGLLVELLVQAGVPEHLIVLGDSSIESAKVAMDLGVDHVVMTGSSRSGRAVLHQLSNSLTPSIMELSGCDAMYVLPGADMHRVCDLLVFGLQLNGGATCLAPRRVFVPRKSSEVFHRLLAERLNRPEQTRWKTKLGRPTYDRMWDGISDALQKGAKIFSGQACRTGLSGTEKPSEMVEMGHMVLTDVTADMQLCSTDLFAPLVMILPVEDWSEALRADSRCPFALTASIFGPTEDALRLVKFVSAGTVTINDLIVPTADPRIPFGGRGESGYGVTRGNEGLLAMTTPKSVAMRLGTWLPHSRSPQASDESLLDGVLQFVHAEGIFKRLEGLVQTVKAILSQRKESGRDSNQRGSND